MDSDGVLADLVSAVQVGLFVWQLEVDDPGALRLIYANPASVAVTGMAVETVLGRTLRDAFPALAQTDVPGIYAEVARGGQSRYLHDRSGRAPFSAQRSYRERVFPLPGMRAGVAFNDVSGEQALAERALDVLETMSDAFYTLDRDTRFTLVNAEAELLMGRSRSEMLGRTLSEAFPAGNGHPLRAAQLRALREQITVVEEAHYAPSGRWLSIRCYPSPEGLAVYFQDVTHHKRLEAQLRRSQKLEAVGQLVSGVAHDFNNLLTVIEGYSTLARQRLDAEEPFVTRALGEIQRASASASALTAKLLAFGRADEPDTTISDITTIVTGALNLVAPLIGEDIIVHRDLDSQPHHAVVDTALIEQVIVNLAVNARDAMPGGGNLWVSTGSLELDPDPAHALAAGRYVFVRVRDDGAGIDADTLAQVFDPFFTTKPTGMGTGLGLATASLTVSKAGGRLDVTSSPGQGASFTVWLPEIDAGDGLRGSEPVEPGGLILLVDDEAPLRNLFARSLRADGYVVVEASGPAEALAACAEQVFDLLITDGLLPDGGGAALAAAAVARHPDLAILHISGAGADAFPRSDATIRVDFLAKPFTVEQLAESARRLLHRRSAT